MVDLFVSIHVFANIPNFVIKYWWPCSYSSI